MAEVGENDNKINIKLYPLYKMLSWDLLFYHCITFLFLTQVKGISASQVFLGEACYTIFKFVFQIPMTTVIDKIGKRKCLIAGNILISMSIFILIILTDFKGLLVSQFLSAIGYIIKGIVESNILYDSLPMTDQRGSMFSKIDGKATSYYYYFEAITAVLSGFLYVFNAYIPMVLCFILCVISTVISVKFKETTQDVISTDQKEKDRTKKYFKELKYSFRYMFKSKRLRSLIFFYAIFTGLLSVLTTLRSSLFRDLMLPEQYFGIIFAGLQIISGIGSKNQAKIQNRFKNRTLAYLGIPTTISCIIIGSISKSFLPIGIILGLVIALYVIQYIAKGPYYILIDRYLKNFTNPTMRTRISSIRSVFGNIFAALMSLLVSLLLGITNTANAFIIIGSISTIAIVLLLDYMNGKVGLKPEEYRKEEVTFAEVK